MGLHAPLEEGQDSPGVTSGWLVPFVLCLRTFSHHLLQRLRRLAASVQQALHARISWLRDRGARDLVLLALRKFLRVSFAANQEGSGVRNLLVTFRLLNDLYGARLHLTLESRAKAAENNLLTGKEVPEGCTASPLPSVATSVESFKKGLTGYAMLVDTSSSAAIRDAPSLKPASQRVRAANAAKENVTPARKDLDSETIPCLADSVSPCRKGHARQLRAHSSDNMACLMDAKRLDEPAHAVVVQGAP